MRFYFIRHKAIRKRSGLQNFQGARFALFVFSGYALALAEPARLSLEDALHEALLKNRNYQISNLDAKVSENAVSWGRAEALPKVDILASQIRSTNDTRLERRGAALEEKFGAKSTNTLVGITGSWTLFEGFSSLAAHDRLAFQAQAMAERHAQARQDIAALLILTYIDVARQQSLLAAMDSAVTFSQERVKITQSKFNLGALSKLELLQAKLDLNQDLSAQLKQSALLTQAQYSLNMVLARSDTLSIRVEDSIPLSLELGLPSATIQNEEVSPEIRQAGLGRDLAASAYREYRGHLFPQLGISVGYNFGLTESEVGLLKSNETLGWNYGVNLKWNIFDGFVAPADYRKAKAGQRQADLKFEDALARWKTTLSQTLAYHRACIQILKLEEANRSMARENVTIAMERLRLGTIASLELRSAQEKYVSAETRFLAARYECKRTETEYLRLIGKLVPENL